MKSKYVYVVNYPRYDSKIWGIFSSYRKAKKATKLWKLNKSPYKPSISTYTVNYRFESYESPYPKRVLKYYER